MKIIIKITLSTRLIMIQFGVMNPMKENCTLAKMKTIILIIILSCSAIIAAPTNQQKIAGGTIARIENWPYTAALLYTFNGQSYWQACGGTILTSTAILSAAHCYLGDATWRWQIRAGSTHANSGGFVYTLRSITIHPDYDAIMMDNDISVLRTTNFITYNAQVQPASIAGINYNLQDDQVVWAIGWGATSSQDPPSEELRQVQIWTINRPICRNRYFAISMTVTDNMICAGWLDVGGRDQCQGDSGSPLIHNNVVVGVSSWVNMCGDGRYPSVNTYVPPFTNWIQNTAQAA